MSNSAPMSRRHFIAGATAGALSLSAKQSWAQQETSDLAAFFADGDLRDQYGAPFKPATLFGDKPVIFIFGYNNCRLCEGETGAGIVDSVAALQQELLRQKKNIPIVLVDTVPGIDQPDAKEHVAMHYEHGVRQFASEPVVDTTEAGEKAFEAGSKKEPAGRLFHIAYAKGTKGAQWVEDLQTKMGLLQDPNDNYNHSLDAVLFVKGKKQEPMLTVPPGKDLGKFQTHGKKLAQKIIDQAGIVRE